MSYDPYLTEAQNHEIARLTKENESLSKKLRHAETTSEHYKMLAEGFYVSQTVEKQVNRAKVFLENFAGLLSGLLIGSVLAVLICVSMK